MFRHHVQRIIQIIWPLSGNNVLPWSMVLLYENCLSHSNTTKITFYGGAIIFWNMQKSKFLKKEWMQHLVLTTILILYKDRYTSWLTILGAHQAAIVFGFLAWICNATSTGGSHGPQIRWIWNIDAHWVRAFWDTGPRYPRGVPWDQNFGLKNFLISSSNEVILWVLWVTIAKNAEKSEKPTNFAESSTK